MHHISPARGCHGVNIELKKTPIMSQSWRRLLCLGCVLYLIFRSRKDIAGDYELKGWGSLKLFARHNSTVPRMMHDIDPSIFDVIQKVDTTYAANVTDPSSNPMVKLECGTDYGVLFTSKGTVDPYAYQLRNAVVEINGFGCLVHFKKKDATFEIKNQILHFGYNRAFPEGDEGDTFACAGLLDPETGTHTSRAVLCFSDFRSRKFSKSIRIGGPVVTYSSGQAAIWAMPRSFRRPFSPGAILNLNRYGLCQYTKEPLSEKFALAEFENNEIMLVKEECAKVLRQENGLQSNMLGFSMTLVFTLMSIYVLWPSPSRETGSPKLGDSHHILRVDVGSYFFNYWFTMVKTLSILETAVNMWQIYPELLQFTFLSNYALGDIYAAVILFITATFTCFGVSSLQKVLQTYFMRFLWLLVAKWCPSYKETLISILWKPRFTRLMSVTIALLYAGYGFGMRDHQILADTKARFRLDGERGYYLWAGSLRYNERYLELANGVNVDTFVYSLVLGVFVSEIGMLFCFSIIRTSFYYSQNLRGLQTNAFVAAYGVDAIAFNLVGHLRPNLFIQEKTALKFSPFAVASMGYLLDQEGRIYHITSTAGLEAVVEGLEAAAVPLHDYPSSKTPTTFYAASR